jgi:hypothetical protein
VQVDVGLGEELLAKYGELQEAVVPKWRRALDDVHSGLDAMMALGGTWVGGWVGGWGYDSICGVVKVKRRQSTESIYFTFTIHHHPLIRSPDPNQSTALGVGLFAASRLLHAAYWWADHRKANTPGATRWCVLAFF